MEFPQIDPVAIALGPLQVHWYGLMYLIGFVGGWCLLIWRAGRPDSGWTRDQVSDLVFYVALGVILGGRVGYVLFYNFGKFLDDPLWLFAIWTGGMSFHGGALGVNLSAICVQFFSDRYWQAHPEAGHPHAFEVGFDDAFLMLLIVYLLALWPLRSMRRGLIAN